MDTAGSKDTNEVGFERSTENIYRSAGKDLLLTLCEAEADSDSSPFGGYAMLHHWQNRYQRRIAA
jgi:hypothetical protein